MRRSPGDGPFRPRAWRAAGWAPAVIALAALACSSSSSKTPSVIDCSYIGKCGPDDQLTDPMVVACTNDLADKTCGAVYQALLDCHASEEVCLEGGVGRDDTATFANCASQLDAWTVCQTPPADAGAGGPGADAVADAVGNVEAGEGPDEGTDASVDATPEAAVDAGADAREAAVATPDAGAEAGVDAGADTGITPDAGATEAGSDASLEAAADAGVDAHGPSDARAD